MTQKQCLKIIKKMKRDVCKKIDEESKRLIQSGGINLSDYHKDNYGPPKVIFAVALKNIGHGYAPPEMMKNLVSDYRNLQHF